MVGTRRAIVAVLATAAAVLATNQTSSGIEASTAPRAATLAAPPPLTDVLPAVGATTRTSEGNAASGGSQPQISGNGRWQVFTSTADLDPAAPGNAIQQVFVRDLRSGAVTQLSVAAGAGAPNGVSVQPSVSDNGRYVSFITRATNVVPVSPGTINALVVCDRDPTGATDPSTGELILDQRVNGALTNNCQAQYSGDTPGNSLVDVERPTLAGTGTRIAWVQNGGQGGFTQIRHVVFTNQQGVVVAHSGNDSLPVPVSLPGPSFTIFNELEPTLDDSGNTIAFIARKTDGNDMVLQVSGINGQTPSATRADIDPDNNNLFLGDEAGSAQLIQFGSLSMAFTSFVSFRLVVVDNNPNFGPRPAALALPAAGTGVYVVDLRFFATTKSRLVSRDNAGAPVAATGPSALSPDGRFVAFTTSAPGTHDGQDGAANQQQLVVRDLDLDTARAQQQLGRVKGALVTATAAPSCGPASPAVNCASQNGSLAAISFDTNGDKVSFGDTANDLVAGDSGASSDAFVRTWQPVLSSGSADLGTVQAGDSTVTSLPVQVRSFGPVLFGPASASPAGEFAVEGSTCFPSIVFYPGDSCDVSVRFTPPIGATGTHTGTVSIDSAQYPSAVQVGTLTANVIATGPKSARGETVRGSVNDDGSQSDTGGGSSMISGNGRWQVFVSGSPLAGRTTFDPNPADAQTPPQHQNVFVRDLADPQHTIQISLHTNVGPSSAPADPSRPVAVTGQPTGAGPDGDSYAPSISSDGRFVSFYTQARDIVPYPDLDPPAPTTYVLVVCDRDPSNTKDKAGNPVLDRPRGSTQVPDYTCFPVQSGDFATDSVGADDSVTPRLSGDGTRITWVENIDLSQQRVRVATLAAPGGRLAAPKNLAYVRSDVAGFTAGANRSDTDPDQFDPTLTEDGDAVVFTTGRGCSFSGCSSTAIVETDLTTGLSFRFDTVDNDGYLGDAGGRFDPPATTDDGNRVAFAFRSGASGSTSRVYVATRNGDLVDTVVVSRTNDDKDGSGAAPALSGDGRYVAFLAAQPNMHNGVDPAGGSCFAGGASAPVYCQVVARDLVRDQQRRDAALKLTPSEIVSTSIATTCTPTLPAGRVCAADASSRNPSIDETGSEIAFDTTADDVVPGDTNEIDIEGPEPASDAFVHTWRPQLAVPAMDFGAVSVGGSKTRTFTIRFADLGGSPANFGPISLGPSSIGGTNAADFTILATTCTGRTLHEGPPAGQPLSGAPERCTVKIRFTPQAGGSRQATLRTKVGKNGYPRHSPDGAISYDPAVNRFLTGFGDQAIATPDPGTVDFGTRLPEDPVTKTVVVTNTGSSTLVISGVEVKDTTHPGAKGDYTVDASDCLGSTPAGGSCVIAVTFRDHRVGIRDAVLVIDDNTLAGSTSIGLLARTKKPTVESNPAVSPVRRVITVTGTGFAPNHEVEVGFDGVGQATVQAQADGSFTLAMVVLPNGPQGPRLLFGHSTGYHKSIAGDFPFLVALSSTDPGTVVIRD